METTTAEHASPRARRTVHLREAGSEGILYDVELRRVHVLNSTALAVWKLSLEARTPEEIAASLSCSYGLPVESLIPDVSEILHEFAGLGLLEGERGNAEGAADPAEGAP